MKKCSKEAWRLKTAGTGISGSPFKARRIKGEQPEVFVNTSGDFDVSAMKVADETLRAAGIGVSCPTCLTPRGQPCRTLDDRSDPVGWDKVHLARKNKVKELALRKKKIQEELEDKALDQDFFDL